MEDNPNAYFDAISAQRALLLDQEEALAGNATLSLETQEDDSNYGFCDFVLERFDDFVTHIRKLPKRDQEMLLSYYLLKVCQTRLAKIHRTTQTLASVDIRRAASAIATVILFGGDAPTAERMAPILAKAGEEKQMLKSAMWGRKQTTVNASELIAVFADARSYSTVADKFNVFRPELRRLLRGLAEKLPLSPHWDVQALGSWLAVITDKVSAEGTGYHDRQRVKFAHMYKKDSPILGEFRIDVTNPDFDELFSPHALL